MPGQSPKLFVRCLVRKQGLRFWSDWSTFPKPICTLEIEDQDFLALMSGKLPAMQAYTSGKLKIEGDIMKSQLIEIPTPPPITFPFQNAHITTPLFLRRLSS